MPAPKIEVFTVYSTTTGAPLSGLTPTFTTYKDDLGNNVTPQPVITEIGTTGIYRFTPTFPGSSTRGVAYVVDTGGNDPLYYSRFIRPEDWNGDMIQDLMDLQMGKWQISSAGPDANRLVLYRPDGTTVIARFDLKDLSGNPSITNIFQRVPV